MGANGLKLIISVVYGEKKGVGSKWVRINNISSVWREKKALEANGFKFITSVVHGEKKGVGSKWVKINNIKSEWRGLKPMNFSIATFVLQFSIFRIICLEKLKT